MVSIKETSEAILVGLLEEALHELARLHASVECERRVTASWVADKLLVFSPTALDRLHALVRDGYDAIARRTAELSATDAARSGSTRPLADNTRSAADGETAVIANPRSLLAAYRASARALCASIVEARKISDATTAALLSGVVHRLEKQLWLLDSCESRPHVGLSAINLFLSC